MTNEQILQELTRTLRGDVEAYGAVVEALHPEIRGFCALLGARTDHLDDLCQDIFIAAFDSIAKFDLSAPSVLGSGESPAIGSAPIGPVTTKPKRFRSN